ncbi:SgcJ/EcaC family oxidoreductase [Primorskyibacter sp. 2E107]|uniref:SgcJ/EcaC family oxidoreductase n=1 Tax=Primorskyibacter sp. 2E107 TaxID=3403458 RepID=UPI003AF4C75A
MGGATPLADPADMPRAFADAWETRDGARIAALFTEDADFVNVTGLWWHGRAAIARPHDEALKSFFAQTRLRIGRSECRMLGPDAAIVRARVHMTGQIAPDGSAADARQTILSFVLTRGTDGWLAVSGQNTEISPGMETHLAGAQGPKPVTYRKPGGP